VSLPGWCHTGRSTPSPRPLYDALVGGVVFSYTMVGGDND